MADGGRVDSSAENRGRHGGEGGGGEGVEGGGGQRLARLSLNTATVRPLDAVGGPDLIAMVAACARAGVPWIAPWRQQFAEVPVAAAARAIRDAGLRVSSLCRGSFFPAATAAARQESIEDNVRAIDEAAELGTDVLVLVCGGVVDKDIKGSRQ